MADVGLWDSIVRDLAVNGHFRAVLQPAVAIILGIRLGLTDEGHAPALVCRLAHSARWKRAGQRLHDVLFPLGVALLVDGILQYLTLGRMRPVAALIVGALLAWLPFAATRELTSRLWARRPGEPSPHPA
jgi:hypothetical protein